MSSNLPQRVTLPDGTEVWVRATPLDERVAAETRAGVPAPVGAPEDADPAAAWDPDADDEPQDVADWGRLTARLAGFAPLVGGVAASVRAATAAAAPHEVSVTFGVEISAGTGKAIALLADANTAAQLSVTLTWQPGSRSAEPSGDASHAASATAPDTAASGASGASATASAPV
ncbi:CU044_2847 family protein [Streptomyces sp. WMMC500]|uniref:CU044_2847 family protein n=1 Tax=Streptomyces sp. WMMC500 TaxID=3015154 RepID=UPI00248D16C5|nr:CU044_2847 family protein [Streptomyces sp. WMMC500]WBB63172.1 CU044_2847 family protein [Streptomyces sp. WMMC500]